MGRFVLLTPNSNRKPVLHFRRCYIIWATDIVVIWTKKRYPTIRHEGAWMERRYSSYSFSIPALDGRQCSASRLGVALAPGKGPTVPIVQEAGWAPEPVWTQRLGEKSFRLCLGSNFNRPIAQPVARHYTAWATLLTVHCVLWWARRIQCTT
jgi:hypothetical protein